MKRDNICEVIRKASIDFLACLHLLSKLEQLRQPINYYKTLNKVVSYDLYHFFALL